jgi:LAGLIDADG endonuclease
LIKALKIISSKKNILLFSTKNQSIPVLSYTEKDFDLKKVSKEKKIFYKDSTGKFYIEFIEWLVFSQKLRGIFLIITRKTSKGEIRGFEFLFRIALHIDDIETLNFIKQNLGCGKLRKDRDTSVFIVSNLREIENKLFPVLDIFNLNSTKHLKFLSFKKAFYIYKDRKVLKLKNTEFDYITEILKLKNSMNDKRICFSMPTDHQVIITNNYLLGLIEGDG